MLKLKMFQNDYSVFLELNERYGSYTREIRSLLDDRFIYAEFSKRNGKCKLTIDKDKNSEYIYKVLEQVIKPFCKTNDIEFDLLEITEPPEEPEKSLDLYDIDIIQELDPYILKNLLNELIDTDSLDYDSLMYELGKYEND